MFTLDTSEDAEMPSSTTSQKLYLFAVLVGGLSAVLMAVPGKLPSIIGVLGAFVATGCLLAIPYRLLGLIERGDEEPVA